MSQPPNTPLHAGPRRRSQRVLMQVPVKLTGADAQGAKFEEETETLAINAHGALVLIQARLTSGSKIQLQHKRTSEEQECHVVFLGPVRGNKAEIGLEFSAPRPQFWRVAFPPEDWSPKSPESRTVSNTWTQKK
ncbi:MAG: PilZ domain-containing protein [Acidobacteria bacterium]|nr:PilZ domain-containing protein [Acidobacteriota bacterium]MBS1864400.1 PilZ domain-containing protein [Acidobacteriota bacterium]